MVIVDARPTDTKQGMAAGVGTLSKMLNDGCDSGAPASDCLSTDCARRVDGSLERLGQCEEPSLLIAGRQLCLKQSARAENQANIEPAMVKT
jgi:hypothetical protein